MNGWYGVDLDASLAYYDGWKGSTHIGQPITKRVKDHLTKEEEVRIFTARASTPHAYELMDYQMLDRAIQLIPNTGERADGLD